MPTIVHHTYTHVQKRSISLCGLTNGIPPIQNVYNIPEAPPFAGRWWFQKLKSAHICSSDHTIVKLTPTSYNLKVVCCWLIDPGGSAGTALHHLPSTHSQGGEVRRAGCNPGECCHEELCGSALCWCCQFNSIHTISGVYNIVLSKWELFNPQWQCGTI